MKQFATGDHSLDTECKTRTRMQCNKRADTCEQCVLKRVCRKELICARLCHVEQVKSQGPDDNGTTIGA